MARLIDRICKHNRKWQQDVVITVPVWGMQTRHWHLRMTIIGFAGRRCEFVAPEQLVQTIDWNPVPPVGGNSWQIKKATVPAIREMVSDAVRYSPGLLFPGLDPHFFEKMADLTKILRTKFHGKTN